MTNLRGRKVAVVTGASAGIGAALARVFARNGYDLVLVARRPDPLHALARELELESGAQVSVLPTDLAHPDSPKEIAIRMAERHLQPDALVNSAGRLDLGAYIDLPWKRHSEYMQLTLASACELIGIYMPAMVERGFGRIINVASLGGLLPAIPNHALYGPSKAFLVAMSRAMNAEVHRSGVHVTALCPGFTVTELFNSSDSLDLYRRRFPAWLWHDVNAVALAGYDAVEANRAVCVPGLQNKIIAGASNMLPDPVALAIARWAAGRLRNAQPRVNERP